MERSARTQRTLSKQAEFDEDDEVEPTFSVEKEQETETSIESAEIIIPPHSTNNAALHRSRSQSKVKLLVRSHAVREETSPPPDPPPSPTNTSSSNANINNNNINNNNNNINGNCLSVSVTRHKLRREGSSQGSMDSNWSALSRGSSIDQYTDDTGVDLEQFIADTLNRNQKDKVLLLKIEYELVSLIKDSKRSIHKFPSMSSYQRMLVHRVAAYFGMEHNVDPSGHQVVVNKTKSTRLPDSKFNDLISSIHRDDLLFPEEPRRSILKRDSSSFDETCSFKSSDRLLGSECRRSKSFEEREEEYEKARRRIFNREHGYSQSSSQEDDDLRWPGEVQPWTSSESEPLPMAEGHQERKSRMLKVESYESKDTLRANSLRLSFSKSFSFGGYDQSSLNTRILTKQDSGSSMSSRLSPSSSGYKSQSQRSDITLSATPSPSATPQLTTQLSSQSRVPSPEPEAEQQTVMWAVTSMDVVPRGSVLINPQTGQPYTNSDGSIYHFDPENPPKMSPEEESLPENPDPPSATLAVQQQNQSDPTVTKKLPSKLSNATTKTAVPPCTEAVQPTVSMAFCNKSSHSLTSQDASHEHTQVSTKNMSNVPQLVRNQQQQVQQTQSMLQPQVPSSAHVPYPLPYHQPCYPQQPAYTSMGTCNIFLQPPVPPPEGMYSVSPQQPLVFPVPAAYEQKVAVPDGHSSTQDLNSYLMNLNLGESMQNVSDNRSIVYWPSGSSTASSHPSAHISQGQNQSLPVFYAPPNTPLSSNHTVAPRYPSNLNGYTQVQPMMSMERTGGGYLPPSEWHGPPYPQPVPMYYNTQCNNGQNSMPNSSVINYCNNTNSGPNGVLIQFPPASHPVPVQPSSQPSLTSQQNHLYNNKMPTAPSNQQPNICPQYTMYGNTYGMGMGGCYPLHYAHTTNASTPSHPSASMLHPPNIQMGTRSSPPLRAYGTSFGHSKSPAVKERSAVICPGTFNLNLPENSVHSSSPCPIRFANVPTHTHMPFYVTRLLPHTGDVRLMGSSSPSHRLGFPVPTNSNHTSSTPPNHMRKSRVYARNLM